MDTINIKIGDRITFKVATRSYFQKATRVVNGRFLNDLTVSYHGWPRFIVKRHEVLEHHPKEEK